MGDVIRLRGIQVPAALGVEKAERLMRRPVEIDLDLECDLRRSAASDDLRDTLDYAAVFDVVARVAAGEHHLVEALAERLCSSLFAEFPQLDAVRIDLRKIAPLPGVVRTAGVEIERRRAPVCTA